MDKQKPVRIQLNAPHGRKLDAVMTSLSVEVQTFLNANHDFEIVHYAPASSPQDADLEQALADSEAFEHVEALKRQAAAYVLAGLRADKSADVSIRLLCGTSATPSVLPDDEDTVFWDNPCAVVGVLGARLVGCLKPVILYPSVYSAGYLGKDSLGPHQAEDMAHQVIRGIVQRWRRDFVRNALRIKKAA